MSKNIEKLQGLRMEAYEIATQNPKKLAIEMKQAFADDIRKLKASEEYRDLGTGGRVKREEKLREEYRKQLFEVLKEQKASYQKIYDEATTLAKTLLTTPAAAPKDALAVKLFEQELQSLKTSTMLGTNAKATVQAVDAFIGKYGDDPYFASIIKGDFSQLSQNILSIENTMQNRQSLANVYERVEAKSLSEEQVVANEMLEIFGDGVPNFYRAELPVAQSIQAIVGGQAASYLNKPEEWNEAQAQAAQQAE